MNVSFVSLLKSYLNKPLFSSVTIGQITLKIMWTCEINILDVNILVYEVDDL